MTYYRLTGQQAANGIRLTLAAALAAGAMAAPAHAEGTLAGTSIDNVATATYDLGGGQEATATSNIVSLKVDELLDVSVASNESGDVGAAAGAVAQLLRFTISNGGNGNEKFGLSTVDSGGNDDFNPSVTAIVLDANDNGAYDAGVDTVYVAGVNDPELAPDASLAVFVLSTIPSNASNAQRGKVDLKAVAKTGSGDPGDSFAGQGQGGGDAVVGATGADAEDDGYYAVNASAEVSLVKSASVSDIYGGSARIPGSTITYTLVASVTGSGTISNLRVSDPIPEGTTYAAESLTLEGASLSDASDSDAGSFSAGAIAVGLGDVASGATRTVTFKVKID